MAHRIVSRKDSDVSQEEDGELRLVLASCFEGSSELFSRQRYCVEPPDHRWMVVDEGENILGHAAIRLRDILTEGGSLTIAGISEVCVLAAHRGQGYVREMLSAVHDYIDTEKVQFALLFGKSGIYASSGYEWAPNCFRHWNPEDFAWVEEPLPDAMVRNFSAHKWPRGLINLRGVVF